MNRSHHDLDANHTLDAKQSESLQAILRGLCIADVNSADVNGPAENARELKICDDEDFYGVYVASPTVDRAFVASCHVERHSSLDDDELDTEDEDLDDDRSPDARPWFGDDDDDEDLDEDPDFEIDIDRYLDNDTLDLRQGMICQSIVARVAEDRKTLFAFILDVLQGERVREAGRRQVLLAGDAGQ